MSYGEASVPEPSHAMLLCTMQSNIAMMKRSLLFIFFVCYFIVCKIIAFFLLKKPSSNIKKNYFHLFFDLY